MQCWLCARLSAMIDGTRRGTRSGDSIGKSTHAIVCLSNKSGDNSVSSPSGRLSFACCCCVLPWPLTLPWSPPRRFLTLNLVLLPLILGDAPFLPLVQRVDGAKKMGAPGESLSFAFPEHVCYTQAC